MAGQHRDDMEEYTMTKYMGQNRSVWHVKIKAGPLCENVGVLLTRVLLTRAFINNAYLINISYNII